MSTYLRSGFGRHVTGPSDPGDGWRSRAACRNHNPELFFPLGDGESARFQEREAQRVCRDCPVREQCREWAIEARQQHGVWGGMTERQLRSAIRQDRPKLENRGTKPRPCGTWAAYKRHMRNCEPIDDACRQAQIEHSVKYAKKREAAKRQEAMS